MISTRLHGVIDYGVAALFGRLATAKALPSEARTASGATGAYHAVYAWLTNYAAGLRPAFGMRQHLVLDAAGAAALFASGIRLRRLPPAMRLMPLATGMAEGVVVACSSATPRRNPGSDLPLAGRVPGPAEPGSDLVGEAPLDMLKPVARDVFIVDSTIRGPFGLMLPVRMTVIRLADGDLLLHSPTRLTPALRHALERIGRIRHLVAPDTAHWSFMPQWQAAYPEATTWAAPGLRARGPVRRSLVRLDHDLDETTPPGWDGIVLVVVPGGLGFREVALFHQPTGTLVLTDVVQNMRREQVPAIVRPLAVAIGLVESGGKAPLYLRAALNLRRRTAAQAASAADRRYVLSASYSPMARGSSATAPRRCGKRWAGWRESASEDRSVAPGAGWQPAAGTRYARPRRELRNEFDNKSAVNRSVVTASIANRLRDQSQ